MIIFLGACKQTEDERLGYLKPPEAFQGFWQNLGQDEFFIEFLSDSEYRSLFHETNISDAYVYFKIFHITDNGLVYVLVREVWNEYYDDPIKIREMTPEEIANSDRSQFYYELFDLSGETTYSDSKNKFVTMRVFNDVCEEELKKNSLMLSEADFHRPAAEHWARVRPGGLCEYDDVFWNKMRPSSSGSTLHGFRGSELPEWIDWR